MKFLPSMLYIKRNLDKRVSAESAMQEDGIQQDYLYFCCPDKAGLQSSYTKRILDGKFNLHAG